MIKSCRNCDHSVAYSRYADPLYCPVRCERLVPVCRQDDVSLSDDRHMQALANRCDHYLPENHEGE